MLAKLDDGSYNRRRIESKAKNHIAKLKQNPLDFSEQDLQVEIIPYEELWLQIMDLLDLKKQKVLG